MSMLHRGGPNGDSSVVTWVKKPIACQSTRSGNTEANRMKDSEGGEDSLRKKGRKRKNQT